MFAFSRPLVKRSGVPGAQTDEHDSYLPQDRILNYGQNANGDQIDDDQGPKNHRSFASRSPMIN